MSLASLSVVVPAYDERESLPILVEEIESLASMGQALLEIIIVDDGSRDGTADVLDELSRRFDRVRVIHLEEHRGQTAALAAGIDAAKGELVATLDADLQNDPADIPRLLEVLESSGADMVTGVRARRRDSLWKRIQSRVGNTVRNVITGDRVKDTGCTLRVAYRSVVDGLLEFDGAHRFVPTLARIRGAVVVEEAVRHRARRYGSSKYGVRNRALEGLALCFEVRRRRKRAVR